MSCPRRIMLILHYVDELSFDLEEMVIDHLPECEKCSRIMEDLERGRQEFLKRHPADKVVPGLLAEADRRERSWWRRFCWWAWGRYLIVDLENIEKKLR